MRLQSFALLWGAALALELHDSKRLREAVGAADRLHSVLAIDLQASDSDGSALKATYPFYHTTAEIAREARRLAAACNGTLSVRTVQDGEVVLDVAHVRLPSAQPSNRVFLLFGEHSRELISPETGLHLLRALCGEGPAKLAQLAVGSLQDNEFQLVLNANPRSRRKVEGGDYCLRTNPDGVDLNRNWDERWQSTASSYSNANPGPRPFSEPETRLVKQLVSDFRPVTFVTVHSGTRGLYMPWAYDTEHLANRNAGKMLEVLRYLDERHCQCPFGAAGKEVGYSCPGTCLDWVYDKLQTPYSFAFEIYTSADYDASLKRRWTEKVRAGGAALLQEGEHLGHPHFLDLFQRHSSDFVQTRARAGFDEDPGECFGLFNPETKELYDTTVQNWVTAYLEMCQKIVSNLREERKAGVPAK